MERKLLTYIYLKLLNIVSSNSHPDFYMVLFPKYIQLCIAIPVTQMHKELCTYIVEHGWVQ